MEKFNIDGIVVVTGGSGMLGKQYCKAICDIGGVAISLDIVPPSQTSGTSGMYLTCDITDEDSILGALLRIKEVFPKIPIVGLINNAAIDPKFEATSTNTPGSRLEGYPREQWDKELSVGLTGAFLCTKVFGREMAKNGKGAIVNISSVLGHVAPNQALYKLPPQIKVKKNYDVLGDASYEEEVRETEQPVKPVTYSVIKHAIIGLTRYTATYWASNNVRCNALSPGGVYNGHSDEFVEKLSKYIPLGRMAQKDEYNSAIQFLLTDASSFMTGAVLQMDGGQSCW